MRSAQKLLKLARENGGIFIKAAQFAASIRGPVPSEYVDALSEVQDRAPSRPWQQIEPHLKEQLGVDDLKEVFSKIDERAVAAASLAQVHRAMLQDGTDVAVKVQYPGLQAQITNDLNMIQMAMMMFKDKLPLDVGWLINELRVLLARECDFTIEAANSQRAAKALAWRGAEVCVPVVVAQHSSKQVLVTEFAEGLIRMDDSAALEQAGLDAHAVGDLVARVCSEMVLVHGLVHGDPHAGNVYVRPRKASGAAHVPPPATRRERRLSVGQAKPQIVILDHGLYFELEGDQRRSLCLLLRALVHGQRKNAQRHADALVGPLAGVFPVILSPWFAAGLSLREAAALARGEFSITLSTVVDFLKGMEGRSRELLGTVHSLGYTRGMLEALGYGERQRLQRLGGAAEAGLDLSAFEKVQAGGTSESLDNAETRADAALVFTAAKLQAARAAMGVMRAGKKVAPLLFFYAPVAIAAVGTYATVGGVATELLGIH